LNILRNINQDTIKNYQNVTIIETWPNLDGIVIPDDPFYLFKNGNFNKVDFIFGANLNEGTLWAQDDLPYEEFQKNVEYLFPNYFKKVLDLYPINVFKSGRQAISQLLADFTFLCPGRALLNFGDSNKLNVYSYLFTHIPSFMSDDDKIKLGSFHRAEIYYVFNNPLNNFVNKNNRNFTSDEALLSNQIAELWTGFAKNGIPRTRYSNSTWKKYNTYDQNTINFNISSLRVYQNYTNSVCDLYDMILNSNSFYLRITDILLIVFSYLILLL